MDASVDVAEMTTTFNGGHLSSMLVTLVTSESCGSPVATCAPLCTRMILIKWNERVDMASESASECRYARERMGMSVLVSE